MTAAKKGRLFVVATPIGCLEDVTLRALRVLGECDAILAEDTRHTRRLLTRHDLHTPLRSLHAHTTDKKLQGIVTELTAGAQYALVSDAGTPVVSDPGAHLVARAADAGVPVEAVPGPSAVLAALSVAGFRGTRFSFEGFFAKKGRERTNSLRRIATSDAITILFESPRRLLATLKALEEALGSERQIAVCRELTKIHEEVIRGSLADVRKKMIDPPRGEVTLVLAGAEVRAEATSVDVDSLIKRCQKQGLSSKDTAKKLQGVTGWSRSRAYRTVLDKVSPPKRVAQERTSEE